MEAKNWWKSKTVWLGILTVSIGILTAVAEFLARGDFSPSALVLMISGAMGVILRFITDKPLQ
jgi:hypothetical protein